VTTDLAARHQLPEEVRAATAELDALGVPFDFPLAAAHLPWSAAGRMAASCAAYLDGVDALVAGYAQGDPRRLAAALRLPDDMLPLWDALPAHDWAVIARPDVIVQGERTVVIEPNATSHAALFALNDLLLRSQRQARPHFTQPDAVPLFTMNRYARLLREWLAATPGIVAICYWAVEDVDDRAWAAWYYRTCMGELRRYGVTARIAHVEQLRVGPDGVWLGDERVGVVHRFFEPPTDAHEWEEVRRVGDAARRGLVTLLTDYRGEVFAAKGCLALLSDERYLDGMPRSLTDRLSTAVPWTRLLEDRATVRDGNRVDLLPWVLRHRSDLVLKGMHGLGGNQVVVGREVSAHAWGRAVDEGLRAPAPWLVQELVVPDQEDMVLFEDGERVTRRLPVVYGAFLLQRRFVGAIRRYGVRGMGGLNINGHEGAIPTPVYWTGVDETAVPADLLVPEQT
jgi:hypothetical protein